MKSDTGSEFTEVTKELVGWEDNKVWRTIRTLTVAPGVAIKAYCTGDKSKYLSPVTYYFAMSALYYYLLSVSGLEAFYVKDTMPAIANIVGKWAEANPALEFLSGGIGEKIISLPSLLFVKWFVFRKYNSSFKQNAWYSLYNEGHATWLNLPVALWWWASPMFLFFKPMGYIVSFLALSYEIWSSRQFYSLKWSTAIVLNIIINILLFLLTLVGVVITIGIFYFLK